MYSEWFIYPYGSVVQNIEIHCFGCMDFPHSVNSGQESENQPNFHYGTKLNIAPGQNVTVLLVFKSDYFFAPIKILFQPYQEIQQSFKVENVILMIGLGICLALSIYNFFIFASTKKFEYLNYAGSTLFYALGWSAVFAIPEYLGFKHSDYWLMPAFLAGSLFTCLFSIQFLKLKSHLPRIAKTLLYLCFAIGFSLPFAFYNQGLGMYLASIFTSLPSKKCQM